MPNAAVAEDLEPLRFRCVPVVSFAFGLLGTSGVVASVIATGETLGWRAGTGLIGLAILTISVLIIRKRLALVEIDGHVRYQRLATRTELPSSAAVKIDVQRRRYFQSLTCFDLVVLIEGAEYRLPIAAHYYFGSHHRRRAESVARRLGIEIDDPLGDEWRSSRSLVFQLMADGRKWVLALGMIAVPALLILVLALALG